MLIIYIAAIFGIFRFRSRDYWKWLAILFVWMFSANFLFYAGGTLADPSGDGFITRHIRAATNDGPGMGIFAIAFIAVYWGGAIWIFRKMYLIGKQAEAHIRELEEETGEVVGMERKLAEVVLTSVVAAAYIYVAFIIPRQTAQLDENPSSVVEAGSKDLIAEELLQAANEINRSTPQKIDEVTTLASVSTIGRMLTYHYEVSKSGIAAPQLREYIRDNAVRSACQDSNMRQAMKVHGVTYRYSYMLPGASEPIEVDATAKKCGVG